MKLKKYFKIIQPHQFQNITQKELDNYCANIDVGISKDIERGVTIVKYKNGYWRQEIEVKSKACVYKSLLSKSVIDSTGYWCVETFNSDLLPLDIIESSCKSNGEWFTNKYVQINDVQYKVEYRDSKGIENVTYYTVNY